MRTCPTVALEVILELTPLHQVIKQAANHTMLLIKTEWSDSTLERLLEDSTIQWYTDGSKTPEGIGAGIAGPRTTLSIPMGCFPNIFQAEVFAIGQCAEVNLSRNYCNQRIAILSDSQAALKAISSYEIKSLLVEECIESLNRLSLCNRVHLIWVPGHKGIEGNENADELARAAAASKVMGPEPFIAKFGSTEIW
ncbi:uncharacterized protein LOC126764419 [Bactrocera neohumeralis]|uniref:uncharacterized protein LOC126764419 n=1 Tax=Bactrocera neohumeralis TaxID=98809 RepID=UPI002164FB79|nr:uncharacterized protein LOC126764419 [Bactrocera neohumeralis]